MIRKVSFFLTFDTNNGVEILEKIKTIPHVYMANITRRTIDSNPIGLPISAPDHEIKGIAVLHLGEIEILKGVFKGIANFTDMQFYPDKVSTWTKYKILTGLTTGGLVTLSILLFIAGDVFTESGIPTKIFLGFLIGGIGFLIEMGIIYRETNS